MWLGVRETYVIWLGVSWGDLRDVVRGTYVMWLGVLT